MDIYTHLDGDTYLVTRQDENVRTALEVYLCADAETLTGGYEALRSDETIAARAVDRAYDAAIKALAAIAPGLRATITGSHRDWNGGHLDLARWRWQGVAVRPVKIVEEYEDGELSEVTINYDSRPDPDRDKIAEEILRVVGGAVQDALIASESNAKETA